VSCLVDRGADIDGNPKFRGFQLLHESSHGLEIVEYGCHCRMAVDCSDHLIRIGLMITPPVGSGVKVLLGPKDSSFGGIANIDRVVLEGQPQELPVIFHQVVIVESTAGHSEDDVIVLDWFGVCHTPIGIMLAVAVQCISQGYPFSSSGIC